MPEYRKRTQTCNTGHIWFFTVVSETMVSKTIDKIEADYPKDSYYLLIFILENS